jgi:hypothetical protein
MPTIASEDYKLADAIKTQLATLLSGKTVELCGDPRVNRAELTGLVIRVRPAGFMQESATRISDADTRQVHVSVVGPVDPADVYAIDTALALVDSVRALWGRNGTLRAKVLSGHVPLHQIVQDPLYDEDELLESELFVSTIEVTYVKNPV